MFRVKRKSKTHELYWEYLLNGKRDREDGPAMEFFNGFEWYRNGIRIDV